MKYKQYNNFWFKRLSIFDYELKYGNDTIFKTSMTLALFKKFKKGVLNFLEIKGRLQYDDLVLKNSSGKNIIVYYGDNQIDYAYIDGKFNKNYEHIFYQI